MNTLRNKLFSIAEIGANTLSRRAYRTVQNAQMNEATRRVLASASPTMVLDVGGHNGLYRDILRKTLRFTGPIASFEPNPHLASRLQAKSEDDANWRVFPFGLGNENGELNFNIMESSSLSSFLQPTSENFDVAGNQVSEVLSVPVRRLDSLEAELAELGDTSRLFLKMDTQGFDYNVFEGARGLCDRIAAVLTELSVKPIYEGMPTYIQMLELLDKEGFKPICLSPVNVEDGFIPEFDCLLAREDYNCF